MITLNNLLRQLAVATLNIINAEVIDDFHGMVDLKYYQEPFLKTLLVYTNIATNQNILKQLEKSYLLMEFNQQYLPKFMTDGSLSNNDMLDL